MPHPMETANSVEKATASSPERERRQRVLKKAIASYGNRSITVECLARDLSSGGVKLQVTQPLPIPDHFHLEIPMDGISAECEVRWRNNDMIGAVFTSDPMVEQKARQRVDPTGLSVSRKSLLRKPVT